MFVLPTLALCARNAEPVTVAHVHLKVISVIWFLLCWGVALFLWWFFFFFLMSLCWVGLHVMRESIGLIFFVPTQSLYSLISCFSKQCLTNSFQPSDGTLQFLCLRWFCLCTQQGLLEKKKKKEISEADTLLLSELWCNKAFQMPSDLLVELSHRQ